MARPNGAFEFVNGPMHHRTKRIEPEEWERWRPLITELFLEVKLAEVVTRMQLEHGFCANERQYTHHLSKWGVKKQGRGTKTTVTPSSVQLGDTSGLGCRDPLKRRRPSITSIHSVSSADSALSKPPRKRAEKDAALPNRIEPELLVEDSRHVWVEYRSSGTALTSPSDINTASHTGTGTGSPRTPLTPPDSAHKSSFNDSSTFPTVNSAPQIPSHSGETAISPLHPTHPEALNILGPQRPLPPIPFGSQKGKHALLGIRQDTNPTILMTEAESSVVGSVSKGDNSTVSIPKPFPFSYVPVTGLMHDSGLQEEVKELSASSPIPGRAIRAIYANRPVETFSAQDIADIKRAAECLSMFCCNREAFELYITILKGQLADSTCRDNTFWYLIIQCAHTASCLEHIEVINNIILAELARLYDPMANSICLIFQFGSYGATNLLLHMLLVFTSKSTADGHDMTPNFDKARAYLHQLGVWFIFKHLPQNDRSLDLAIYQSILQLQITNLGSYCGPAASNDLRHAVPVEFTQFKLLPENKLPLEESILFLSPGPFELSKHGHMNNPCIRSCILWCEKTLLQLGSISITPGVIDFCTDSLNMTWVEGNALFITLWDHWATDKSPSESTWMTATQERMGISPTELLLLVCRAIHNSYYPWDRPTNFDGEPLQRLRRKTFNGELLRRLRKKAEELVHEPDTKLARRILMQYIWRNTISKRPSLDSAVQRLEKARMVTSFESALLVQFPRLGPTRDLINSVLITRERLGENSQLMTLIEESEEPFPLVNKAPQLSPTLASSLSSVDLSNFRSTGASAMLRLSKFARGSLSSSSESGSGSKMSIAGYSDISTSLRSMSITAESAGRTRASSRAVSVAASGSDRPVEEPGEERNLGCDGMSVATGIQ